VQHNAPEGKDPRCDDASAAAKAMPGVSGPDTAVNRAFTDPREQQETQKSSTWLSHDACVGVK